MIKVVIFDLDDTLVSEQEYIKSGYKVVARKIKNDFNLVIDEKNIYYLMWNLFNDNSKNVFNRLLNYFELDYDEIYISKLVKTYREHNPNINFYNDVVPCLNQLKNKNIKLGIITDGYKVSQKNKLNALNAYKLFDKIIVTDELGKEYWKPSPKAFEIMKEYFNVNYEEIMYIGDNPKKDFYIKKYFPIKTIRICRNNTIYHNEEYLENLKEDRKIRDLNNLL